MSLDTYAARRNSQGVTVLATSVYVRRGEDWNWPCTSKRRWISWRRGGVAR
jgi:hypothetical protein